VTFSLPADLIVRLDEAAAADDRSRSAYVRRALQQILELSDATGVNLPEPLAPANPPGAALSCPQSPGGEARADGDRDAENRTAAERRLQDIRDRCARGPVVGLDA